MRFLQAASYDWSFAAVIASTRIEIASDEIDVYATVFSLGGRFHCATKP